MTFAEVPIGHLFKFLGCDCLVRRDGVGTYVYVRRCPEHYAAIPLGGVATMSEVNYDPFLATLEAEKP